MKNDADRNCPRGRPRAFDADAALDAALRVFWAHGYEGTSLDDLTRATGVNRPSLYAAFGNKESLFTKAVDRYDQRATALVHAALAAPTARAAVERLLADVVVGPCDGTRPAGCLLVGAALTCSEAAGSVRAALAARRGATERLVRERLDRAAADGELPAGADPAGLARFYATVTLGLSVQAAGGATREQQLAVVAVAMRAWPTPATHRRGRRGAMKP